MARRFPPSAGVVVTVLAATGLVAAAVLVVGSMNESDDEAAEEQPTRTDPAAVQALLDAWERSRTSTYVIESEFRRTIEGRSGISSTVEVAQRPPDRLARQSGSVEGRLAGREVSCTTDANSRVHCVSPGRAPPYEKDVSDSVAALAGYVQGDRPAYLVNRADGCFRLRLALELPVASQEYGEAATLCFDPATGAPSRIVVTREGSEDVNESVRIVPKVTDRDLRLPAPIEQTTTEPTG